MRGENNINNYNNKIKETGKRMVVIITTITIKEQEEGKEVLKMRVMLINNLKIGKISNTQKTTIYKKTMTICMMREAATTTIIMIMIIKTLTDSTIENKLNIMTVEIEALNNNISRRTHSMIEIINKISIRKVGNYYINMIEMNITQTQIHHHNIQVSREVAKPMIINKNIINKIREIKTSSSNNNNNKYNIK